MQSTVTATPLGRLLVVADDRGLRRVHFLGGERPSAEGGPLVDRAVRQILAYFAGELRRFDLPLAADGTPFDRRVWHQIAKVPYGATRSYGQIARAIGQPGAARAVGAAAGRNPIAIVVPCHRVVGARGALGGYSAGIHRKQALLELEAAG
jgi:methylated-DNA-[protein]-cysteine S-methyltransferase